VSPITSSDRDPLASYFAPWRSAGRTALIPYLTAGYPTAAHTAELLAALAGAGADIIELGVPFSDPVADGPTIQRSSQRALEQGTTLDSVLDLLASFRSHFATPVVLFSYLNPVLARGVERFCGEAVAAGAQGLLLTDLPLGGDPPLEEMLEQSPLSLVRLIAPTTPPERALRIAERAQGFVYYIARLGVTGAGRDLRPAVVGELQALRARTSTPVAVGFGVSTPEHARLLASAADGVVVGSALIDALDAGGITAAAALIASLRRGLD
jgi:tryptophan synthase alpha chain